MNEPKYRLNEEVVVKHKRMWRTGQATAICTDSIAGYIYEITFFAHNASGGSLWCFYPERDVFKYHELNIQLMKEKMEEKNE